jgi:hypothetical protein
MVTHRRLWFASICAFVCGVGFAQAREPCPDIAFEAALRQQARITVERVEGQAIAAPAAAPLQVGAVGNFCLALFREGSATRVAAVSTQNEGTFAFLDPGPGDYVLMGKPAKASYGSLRVPLRVSRASSGSVPQRGLLLRINLEGGAQTSRAEIIGNGVLRRELLERLKVDQDIRMEAIAKDITHVTPDLQQRMESIDAQTNTFLLAIAREHGWPGIDRVGLDGSGAASTMLQHVSHETQKQLLPLVETAFRAGKVQGGNYAMLVDRVRLGDGLPQIYGTGAKPFSSDGAVIFQPIEDEAGVDARRAEVGLMPLEEYRELLKRLYFPEKK